MQLALMVTGKRAECEGDGPGDGHREEGRGEGDSPAAFRGLQCLAYVEVFFFFF